MSTSLSAERDRLQRQVEELEQSLSLTRTELDQLRSETDDDSDDGDTDEESAAGLLAQREKIQKEIQNLENVLGPYSPVTVSDDDISSNSSESELGLSESVESCLQMNLVYQQVIQETLDQLETLLAQNHKQQREVESHLSGPMKESFTEKGPSSNQQSSSLFLRRSLKPYFKDKLTGLGPPANQETKEKASRMVGSINSKKMRLRRWEGWQKTLLIHSVSRDGLKRLIQPKLSKVDYLAQKLSISQETEKQKLREQINDLERDIELLRKKNKDELILDRYEEHDWQKISNIDFEGTKDAEDIRNFWQNFLHPSINKSPWTKEEVQHLKEISRRHKERNWEAIAAELGTQRTAFMCLQTFQRFVSESLRRSSWTPEEDEQLRELVTKMRIGNFIPYTQISYFMERRDTAQMIYRWNQVLDPSLKKGPWTKEEDQLLLQAVSLHGEKDWWKIKMEVPGRHDSACRDRYLDCLKAGTKRTPFDKQEQELLRKLVEKHGVGRWSKIATEIPHRTDAQCLRAWRKLNKPQLPCSKKAKRTRRTPAKKRRKKKKDARIMMNLKQEEEMEEEEIREGLVIEYMDSDEEKEDNKANDVGEVEQQQQQEEEEEQQQEEEDYTFPPMKEWIPVKTPPAFSFLTVQHVELASSGADGPPVRSTILGRYGRSVIIGPPPRPLPWQKQHSTGAMTMLTRDQLRCHLARQVDRHRTRKNQSELTDKGLELQLQEVLTHWIGNLLVPAAPRRTAADVLREKGEKRELSSTPLFLLLLQSLNVDSVGCKEMIEQRRSNKVFFPISPPPPRSSTKKKPRTISKILQEQRAREKLQQQEQQKPLLQQRPQHLLLLQQPPLPPPTSTPSQSSGVLVQVLPEAFFLSQLMCSPQTPQISPPGVVVTSVPPPPPHGLTPISLVPVPLNATSTCSAAVPRNTGLSIQAPPPTLVSSPKHVPVSSTTTSQPPATPPILQASPPTSASASKRTRGRRKKLTEHQQDVGSSQKGVDVGGAGVGEACSGWNEAGDGVMKEGRRNRKMSLKAKALQEAAEAKANAKKNPPQRKTRTRKSKAKTEPPSAQPAAPATSSCCDTTVSSTQNPPSNPTSSSDAASPSGLHSDHDYASKHPKPDGAGRTGTGVTLGRKRARKTSPDPGAPRNAAKEEAKAKKRKTSLSSPRRILPRPSGYNQLMCVLPNPSTLVMSPMGLVHVSEAPPQGIQEPALVNSPQQSATPPCRLGAAAPEGTVASGQIQPDLRPTVSSGPSENLPSSSSSLPMAPPTIKKEVLQFDTTLMFLESPVEVCKWLSGRGGVIVPGAEVALPYLPPFVSSLSTLSALLEAKKSLTNASLKLLWNQSRPRWRKTTPTPGNRPRNAPSRPADLPDSSTDRKPAENPAPFVHSALGEEEEQEYVATVRNLVAERFSDNPAYKMLKARFLSCFTMPALLATMQPMAKKIKVGQADEEEEEDKEEEEEVQLRKLRARAKERKAERSLLLSGASANQLPGFNHMATPTSDQIGPVQTVGVQ